MDYEQFITEIQTFWDLRTKGLKKQANRFLIDFTEHFTENVSDTEADAILFQFCREYIDEIKFPGTSLPRRHLPFQLTRLLDDYLSRECRENKMPQMRWAYQIFGDYKNPHESILKRAYEHEECDQQTIDLYFNQQLEILWWGQHHFPEDCIITKEEFEDAVSVANKILSEKTVDPRLVNDFEYYLKLYHIYFEWQENGRSGDFCELCREKGLKYDELPAFYYQT